MKRIIYTGVLALGLCIAMTSCGNQAKTEELPDKDLTLQLYSIRELIGDSARFAENHDSVLSQLASMGYSNVEAANYSNGKFYGLSPEDFAAACSKAGLNPLSSHTGQSLSAEQFINHDFEEVMKWWDEAISAHKAAGFKYIVTPCILILSHLNMPRQWSITIMKSVRNVPSKVLSMDTTPTRENLQLFPAPIRFGLNIL